MSFLKLQGLVLVLVVLFSLATPSVVAADDESDGRLKLGGEGGTVTVDAEQGSQGGGSGSNAGSGGGGWVAAEPAVLECLFTIDDWCKMPATNVWRRIDTGTTVDLVATASRAAASLTVPQPVMYVGPDPRNNKWNALAVGLPVWVWADEQAPQSTSVNEQGIQIGMTATRGEVSVDWGDGTTTVCASMTPRPPNIEPMTKSPDCGHVYQQAGDYTITVTASWSVAWAALGQTGSVGLESSTGYGLRVGEFVSVVVG